MIILNWKSKKTGALLLCFREDYGATFILDPTEIDNGTASWGPLTLNPNVESLLLGSGLTPQDGTAPDKVTRISAPFQRLALLCLCTAFLLVI